MTVKPLSEDDLHYILDKEYTDAIIGRGFSETRLKELFAELINRKIVPNNKCGRDTYLTERAQQQLTVVRLADIEELFGPLVRK